MPRGGKIVSVYDRMRGEMEYVNPQIAGGMDLIRGLMPMLRNRGISCAHCKVPYLDFEDFVERNPRRGYGPDLLVDSFCWHDYEKSEGR